MKTRLLFLLTFLLIFVLLQLGNNIPIQHRLMFILNFIVLYFFTIFYLLKENDFSPFLASFVVFSFLFFIIAPMLQIDKYFEEEGGKRFFNGLIYSNALVLKTNTLILIFNSTFFLTYFTFNKYFKKVKNKSFNSNIPFYILIFFGLNILVFFLKFSYLIDKFTLSSYANTGSKISSIINAKFLFYLPFAPLVLGINYIKNNWNSKSNNFYIIFAMVILLFTLLIFYKNPFTARRNALGPVYITLIFFVIPKWINTNFKIVSLLFFSLIVIFPLSSLLTHSDKNLSEMSFEEITSYKNVKKSISDQFTDLHFDAFLMASTTIDYTEKEGHSFGRQLLPSGLFFIPRAIWTNKPVSSGQLMGEHIQKYHDKKRWFHNLSNPFVAESYLDFGVFGVISYAILLAFLCLKFVNWLKTNDPLKQLTAFYFSIHLIFLLRGDLTNGFVYFFIPFIAFYTFPKLIMNKSWIR